jgi:NMD protein affecting ribosome stability and mRNA decay
MVMTSVKKLTKLVICYSCMFKTDDFKTYKSGKKHRYCNLCEYVHTSTERKVNELRNMAEIFSGVDLNDAVDEHREKEKEIKNM